MMTTVNNEWTRSSYCGTNACVEVAHTAGTILVRDSKDPDRSPLAFTPDEWSAFVAGVHNGEFDVPRP